MTKKYGGFYVKYRYYCPIIITFEFSQHIFQEKLDYQVSWKSAQWESSCCVWTDRLTR